MSTTHDPDDAFDPTRHLISDHDLDRLATEQLRAEGAFHGHARRELLAAAGLEHAHTLPARVAC
ncbi:MAG: hypothetical protein EPO40_16675 [Myxococcaceae bacterium]|nr:MAG: hypothetical protein EPO40_16675 [Myxococcaceae bacterium]